MIWGLKEGIKIKSSPNLKGVICPICQNKLIAKCGSIKIWHWAHESNKDCDEWYEPESQWHINWKNNFSREEQEVIIGKHRADIKTKNGIVIELQHSSISSEDIIEREQFYKNMIWILDGETFGKGFDLRNKKGVITFRWKNPPKSWWISNKQIYIDLFEIVNKLKKKLKNYLNEDIKHTTPYYEPVEYEYYDEYGEYHEVSYKKVSGYIDTTKLEIKKLKQNIPIFDNKIFLIKKIYHNIPCGGWGYLISKEEFLKRLKNGT